MDPIDQVTHAYEFAEGGGCLLCGLGPDAAVHDLKDETFPRRTYVSDEQVDHPKHYGGADDPYEAIKVIEAWDLNFSLGSCLKYMARAGKKYPDKVVDLKKARWCLNREIQRLEKQSASEKPRLSVLEVLRSGVVEPKPEPDPRD